MDLKYLHLIPHRLSNFAAAKDTEDVASQVRKQSEEIAGNDVVCFRIPLEIERLQMCQMILGMQWAFGALLGDRCDRIGPRLLNLHEVYTSTGFAWSEQR